MQRDGVKRVKKTFPPIRPDLSVDELESLQQQLALAQEALLLRLEELDVLEHRVRAAAAVGATAGDKRSAPSAGSR